MSCLVLIESREDIYNCLVLREISCKVKRSYDYMTQICYSKHFFCLSKLLYIASENFVQSLDLIPKEAYSLFTNQFLYISA